MTTARTCLSMEIATTARESSLQKSSFRGNHFWATPRLLTGFNGDNRPDFIVTTCDNGEYPSSTKPYPGIRIFLNQ